MNDEKLRLKLGGNIATYRKKSGLTQAGLAEKLNYSDKAISKWERGDSLPDITVLAKISEMFGVTLDYLMKILSARKPNSIKICTLLDKPERRKANVKADYAGAQIPDAFVVGYGLDYDEKYRNLPFVGALKPAVYE